MRKIVNKGSIHPDTNLQNLVDRISRGDDCVTIRGLHGSARAFILSILYKKVQQTVVVVTSTIEEAEGLYGDFLFFLGDDDVLLLPPWDLVSFDVMSSQGDLAARRMRIFSRLHTGKPLVVIAPLDAALQKVIPVAALRQFQETVSIGDSYERDEFCALLAAGGYRRGPLVEEKGEFSVRGHLIDIYPVAASVPVRLEFIGDEIESIKEFDFVTQRSQREIVSFHLTPAHEMIFFPDAVAAAVKNIRNRCHALGLARTKRDRLIEMVENGLASSMNPGFLSLFYGDYRPDDNAVNADGLGTFFDHVPRRSIVVFDEYQAIAQSEDRIHHFLDRLVAKARDKGAFYLDKGSFYTALDELAGDREGRQTIYLDSMNIGVGSRETTGTISFDIRRNVGLRQEKDRVIKGENGLLMPLSGKMRSWIDDDRLVVFLCGDDDIERVSHLLEGYSLSVHCSEASLFDDLAVYGDRGRLLLKRGGISEGFSYPSFNLVIISHEEVFGKKIKRRKGRSTREGFFLKSFGELTEGDYVVHGDHGIGLYRGLLKLSVHGMENDFLVIEYEGGDKLYMPVHRLDQIQRYIGPDGYRPAIERLGGTSWEKSKQKVKKSVQAIARDLISIYATREVMSGHRYSGLDRYYEEFSASFEYEETPDQAGAIVDINGDLSDSRPMDRLVCGDAGFGKTEVAVRASFRVVMDGKQVAVLVPTTILAQQHYQTFSRRFEKYPIRIEVLNRFKKKAAQRQIVEDVNRGVVDVLIGTQRILQDDVRFKDLGLVVIDEEQRFGVKDKERLKKLRALVDVLTLTATPIPRTLQLSLVGIRDLSIIDTPPEDRKAVRVSVSEFDGDVIREAVLWELSRDGQIFFVHDRVNSIYSMGRFLQKLLPEASIGIAHGRMKPRELEDVMVKFIKKEYNLLLCTTIIGSGIDIPMANTMIINRADRFGLAQLYQLRGRVGRSKEAAHAVLLIPKGAMLSRDARKRLSIIQEFSEPGSGFNVSMHDLEIRGAGNFLGVSQSGHVSAVGYEMYTELMEQAVREMRGDDMPDHEIRPEINVGLSAYIPDDYIGDMTRRLVTYKKMSQADVDETLQEIRDELIDCYGPVPTEVNNLMEVIKLRNRLKNIMATKMDYDGAMMIVTFHRESPVDPLRIVELSTDKQFKGMKLTPDYRLRVPMAGVRGEEIITKAERLLDGLCVRDGDAGSTEVNYS
ncbi:MAG: transcription-repair coupling factor [Deltaproteobacteria bacterium]|nr:transcription-repair coupling factor [Deltaproteobacteria bacterium]MBN2686595.1 transcription-repair coupling factor [Deltaproteobacteria bacterium]